jgi:hypothetical protein
MMVAVYSGKRSEVRGFGGTSKSIGCHGDCPNCPWMTSLLAVCQYARFYVSGMIWDLLELTENRLRCDLTNSPNPAQTVHGYNITFGYELLSQGLSAGLWNIWMKCRGIYSAYVFQFSALKTSKIMSNEGFRDWRVNVSSKGSLKSGPRTVRRPMVNLWE